MKLRRRAFLAGVAAAGAIGQLELAIKAGDANFYEMSAIDARLRELKIRRLEELKDKN